MTDFKPNVVLVTSDQHRFDCLGYSGHACVRTPHLDQLAASGAWFSRAYVDCPVCIPQRTTWISGVQSHRYGSPAYNEGFQMDRAREDFLGSLMTAAGYQTYLIGKRHWHTPVSFRAGFETVVPFSVLGDRIRTERGRPTPNETGIGANEMSPAMSHLPPELCSTDWAVDRCFDFYSRYRDRSQPYFLWLSLTDPHPPNVVHEPYYSMYDGSEIPAANIPDWCEAEDCPLALYEHREVYNGPRMNEDTLRKARGVYYGKITNLDHQLGRLFGQLHADGSYDETWIIYTSDHGENLGDYNDFAKSNFLEASAHVPLIVKPPKSFAGKVGDTCDSLVSLDDLLPTLCSIGGARIPSDVTGESWLPLLKGESGYSRTFVHGQIERSHMFIEGKYKYLYFAEDGAELLFDMEADPDERRDLSGDAVLVEPMRQRFMEHLMEERHADLVDGELVNENHPRPPLKELRARCAKGLRSFGMNGM